MQQVSGEVWKPVALPSFPLCNSLRPRLNTKYKEENGNDESHNEQKMDEPSPDTKDQT